MTEYKCDICGKNCGEHIKYFEFIPFILEKEELKIGCHFGGRDPDYPDFRVNLQFDKSNLSNRRDRKIEDICKECSEKITKMIAEELRRKIGI